MPLVYPRTYIGSSSTVVFYIRASEIISIRFRFIQNLCSKEHKPQAGSMYSMQLCGKYVQASHLKERVLKSILFRPDNTNMVLSQKKTQTRRPLKIQPVGNGQLHLIAWDIPAGRFQFGDEKGPIYPELKSPYGKPGEILWVKEPFALGSAADGEGKWFYKLLDQEHVVVRNLLFLNKDGSYVPTVTGWNHARYMPEYLARIFIKIHAVYIERLHDISETDCIAEGVEPHPSGEGWKSYKRINRFDVCESARISFYQLWDSIYGDKEGQSSKNNPWVWKVMFNLHEIKEKK